MGNNTKNPVPSAVPSTNNGWVANDIDKMVSGLLLDYRLDPVDLLSIGDADGEYRYLSGHMHEYVRTVSDLVGQFKKNKYQFHKSSRNRVFSRGG